MTTAKNTGLLPSSVPIQWMDPLAPAGASVTVPWPMGNDHGVTVGMSYGSATSAGPYAISIGYPFILDSTGGRYVPGLWPDGSNYFTDIADDGTIVGYGGPLTPGQTPTDHQIEQPFIRRPDGTYVQMTAAPGSKFDHVVRESASQQLLYTGTQANYGGNRGLATIARWTFDNTGADEMTYSDMPTVSSDFAQVPASPGPDPAVNPWGPAQPYYLHMDGNRCLQVPQEGWARQLATNDGAPGATFMAWVRIPKSACAGGGNTLRAIFMSSWESVLGVQCNGDENTATGAGVTGMFYQPNGQYGLVSASPSISFDTWTHVALTWDHNYIRTYVNGQQVDTKPQTGTFNPYGYWYSVGCWPQDSVFNFIGDMRDVSVTRIPLGADQIANYKDGLGDYSQNWNQWIRYREHNPIDGYPEFSMIPVSTSGSFWWGGAEGAAAPDGTIVGRDLVVDYTQRAMIFRPGVRANATDLNDDLPPSATGWTLNTADAINASKVVAGTATHNGFNIGYKFDTEDPTAEPIDFGNLWPYRYGGYTYVTSINGAGHAAGYQTASPWVAGRAFVYTDESGITDVNDLVNPNDLNGYVLNTASITDEDEIVGLASNASGQYRAYKIKLTGLPSLADVECLGQADGTSCTHGKYCASNNVCFQGTCGGPNPADAVCLRDDGIVDVGGGKLVAIFGYDNTTSSNVIPTAYEVRLDGQVVRDPQPPPPPWLAPGIHVGAFLTEMDSGHVASWRLNGQMVSSSNAPRLTPLPGRSDIAVVIDGVTVVVSPELTPHPVVTPTLAGIVDTGTVDSQGRTIYAAVFSYVSSETTNRLIQLGPDNLFERNGQQDLVSTPQPPTWFLAGTVQPAPFLPTFSAGDTLTWTVAGVSVSATSYSELLPPDLLPDGRRGIRFGDKVLPLLPDPAKDAALALSSAMVSPDVDSDNITAGGIDGKLDVSPDGAATYTIPVWTPPTLFSPDVSVVYNSRSGNSVFGMGFGLTGVSSIKRCVEAYSQGPADGPQRAINFTKTDHLCFEGRLLIPVSGDAWADGTEYRPMGQPFTKVVERNDSNGDPTSFRVTRKDGVVEIYGGTGDTKLYGTSDGAATSGGAGAGTPVTSPPVAWAVIRKLDTAGNRIEYQYQSGGGLDFIPSQIDFGGTDANKMPFSIAFITTSRTDQQDLFQAGYRFQLNRLVSKIEVSAPTPVTRSRVKRYTFNYVNGPSTTARSRLDNVKECDGSLTKCTTPTSFSWTPGTREFKEVVLRSFPEIHGVGGNLQKKYYYMTPADIDGDGKDDIVYRAPSGNQIGLFYALSTGSDFGPPVLIDGSLLDPAATPPSFAEPSLLVKSFLVADLDRDGHPEIIQGRRVMSPGSGAPFFDLPGNAVNSVADVNGDGLPDLIASQTTYIVSPNGNESALLWRGFDWWSVGSNYAASSHSAVTINNYVQGTPLSSAFAATPDRNMPFYGVNDGGQSLQVPIFPELTDINGDGAADFMIDHRAFTVAMSPGVDPSFFRATFLPITGQEPVGWGNNYVTFFQDDYKKTAFEGAATQMSLDLNGDGVPDTIEFPSITPDDWSVHCNTIRACDFPFGGSCDPRSCEDNMVRPRPFLRIGVGARLATNTPDVDLYTHPDAPYSYVPVGPEGYDLNVPPPADPAMDFFRYVKWRRRITADDCHNFMSSISQQCPTGSVALYSSEDPGIRVADINGDGKDDVVALGQLSDQGVMRDDAPNWLQSALVFESAGTSLNAPYPVATNYHPNPGPIHTNTNPAFILNGMATVGSGSPQAFILNRVLDANGDGQPDLLVAINEINDNPYMRLYLHEGEKPDLLKSVTNGVGATDSVNYMPISDSASDDSATYTPGTSCPYPEVCVNRGVWVVSKLRKDNGNTGQQSFSYHYRDSRSDTQGLGWLGFASTVVTNDATKEAVETKYRMLRDVTDGIASYPYLGVPSTTTRTFQIDDTHQLQSYKNDGYTTYSTQVGARSLVDLRITSRMTEERETGADGRLHVKSRKNEKWQDFDGYNNPQTYSSNVLEHDDQGGPTEGEGSDGSPDDLTMIQNVAASMEYQNDTSSWLLGLPKSTTIQTYARGVDYAVATQKVAYTYKAGTDLIETVTRDPQGGGDTLRVTTITRDNPHGLPTKIVQQDGSGASRVTVIGYDTIWNQFRESVTKGDPSGQGPTVTTRQTVYPAFGIAALAWDANDVLTQTKFDTFGRVKQVISQAQGTTNVTYSQGGGGYGTMVAVDAGGRPSQKLWYDQLGRERSREFQKFDASDNAAWAYVNTDYDDVGRLSRVSQPSSEAITAPYPDVPGVPPSPDNWRYTWYHYDGAQRLSGVDFPAEAGVNPTRDINGHVIVPGHAPTTGGSLVRTYSWLTVNDHFYDKKGDALAALAKSTHYDVLGRKLSTSNTEPLSGGTTTTTYHYGPLGNLTKSTDGAQNTTTITYDDWGRQIGVSSPDRGYSEAHYNAFDEPRTQQTPTAYTEITPDELGRPKEFKEVSGPDAGGITRITWDAAPKGIGKVAIATDPDGVSTAFGYDSHSRPSSRTWTIDDKTTTISTVYDQFGRPQTINYPVVGGLAFQVTNGYSDTGYLASVNAADPDLSWTVQRRAPNGLLTNELFANGVTSEHDYFNRGGVKTVRTYAGTNYFGPFLQNASYEYDGLGRVTTAGSEAYTYDYLNRLQSWTHQGTNWWTENYSYDGIGNLKRVTLSSFGYGTVSDDSFTYGENGYGPHALTTAPWGGTFSYDQGGNQKASLNRSSTFTSFNLPRTVTGPSGTTSFTYDAFHQRIRKKTPSGGTIDTFGGIYERRTEGGQVTNVFYVMGDGKPVAEVTVAPDGTESVRYIHDDQLGTVNLVTDASGADAGRATFDPWGRRISFDSTDRPVLSSGGIDGMRLGFTGQEQDDELGLINMHGRVYDPQQRRFVSPDAHIGDPYNSEAYNPYSYVLNNPTNRIDPTGFDEDAPDTSPDPTPTMPKMARIEMGKDGKSVMTPFNPVSKGGGDPGAKPGKSDLAAAANGLKILQALRDMAPKSDNAMGDASASSAAQPSPATPEAPVAAAAEMAPVPQASDAENPGERALDNIANAITVASLVPGVGTVANVLGAGLAAYRGQWGTAAILAVTAALPVVGGVVGKALSNVAAKAVTNPIPQRMARVVAAEFANGTKLAGPKAEAWVTAAEDLAGLKTSEEVAQRLTLVDKTGKLIPGPRAIIEFDAVTDGLASPVFRYGDPGFVGFGRTAGGAREFVLPNMDISQLSNVTIRMVP